MVRVEPRKSGSENARIPRILGADNSPYAREILEKQGAHGRGYFLRIGVAFLLVRVASAQERGRGPRGALSSRMIFAMISRTLAAATPWDFSHSSTFRFVGAVCGLAGSYFVQNS
jgi:hypothetical protein